MYNKRPVTVGPDPVASGSTNQQGSEKVGPMIVTSLIFPAKCSIKGKLGACAKRCILKDGSSKR